MPTGAPNFLANGTIQPSRLVKLDSTTGKNFMVIQVTAATDFPVVGISSEATHDAPGTVGAATDAARTGMPIKVYGLGDECQVEAGGTITHGDKLKSDTSGRVITTTLNETAVFTCVGEALEDAVVGDIVRIVFKPFQVKPA